MLTNAPWTPVPPTEAVPLNWISCRLSVILTARLNDARSPHDAATSYADTFWVAWALVALTLVPALMLPRKKEESHFSDDEAGDKEQEPTGGNGRTRAMRAAQHGSGDPDDEPEFPEDEDEPPLQALPEAIRELFEALYASLTAEQADALAELFAAIAEDPADEAEEPEAPPTERPTHRPPRPKARLAA